MPKYSINLSPEDVEHIKVKKIKDMPAECPEDPKGFLEWIVGKQTENMKREKEMERIAKMTPDEIREALDDWEKKPK